MPTASPASAVLYGGAFVAVLVGYASAEPASASRRVGDSDLPGVPGVPGPACCSIAMTRCPRPRSASARPHDPHRAIVCSPRGARLPPASARRGRRPPGLSYSSGTDAAPSPCRGRGASADDLFRTQLRRRERHFGPPDRHLDPDRPTGAPRPGLAWNTLGRSCRAHRHHRGPVHSGAFPAVLRGPAEPAPQYIPLRLASELSGAGRAGQPSPVFRQLCGGSEVEVRSSAS